MPDTTATTPNLSGSPDPVPPIPAGNPAAGAATVPVAQQRVEWEDDDYEYEQDVVTRARLKAKPLPPPPPPPPPPQAPRVARVAAGVSGWSRKARLSLWGSISVTGIGSLLFAAYYGHAVLAQWGWSVYATVPVVVPAANHSRALLERWRADRRLTGSQRAEAEAAIRADGGTTP